MVIPQSLFTSPIAELDINSPEQVFSKIFKEVNSCWEATFCEYLFVRASQEDNQGLAGKESDANFENEPAVHVYTRFLLSTPQQPCHTLSLPQLSNMPACNCGLQM